MRYIRSGIALLLPLSLTAFVLNWLYNVSNDFISLLFPDADYWWLPIVGFIGIIVVLFIIGLLFSFIKPLKWVYKRIEHWVIMKIPIVKTLYSFGLEISDAFLADIKEDGDLTVVAVRDQFGGEAIGVITNMEHNVVFIPTAPNPTNGFLTVNPRDVRVVATMGYTDAIKFVTSIGRINGGKL